MELCRGWREFWERYCRLCVMVFVEAVRHSGWAGSYVSLFTVQLPSKPYRAVEGCLVGFFPGMPRLPHAGLVLMLMALRCLARNVSFRLELTDRVIPSLPSPLTGNSLRCVSRLSEIGPCEGA